MQKHTQSIFAAGSVIGILLILVLALTSINYLHTLHDRIDTIRRQDIAKIVILNKLSRIVRQRSLRMYAMYFSKDIWVLDDEYQEFNALALEFIQLREKLFKIGLQPREKLIWDEAMSIIKITEPLQDGIVEKLYEGDRQKVGDEIGLDDLPRENRLQRLFDQLLEAVQQQSNIAVAQAQQQFDSTIRLFALITLIVISLSMVNMLLVRRRILVIGNKLQEEKELAQLTLANVVDGIIRTNAHGKVIFINPSAEQISGWDRNAALRNSINEVMQVYVQGGEARIDWQGFVKKLSGTVMPEQRYLELHRRDKETCLVELSIVPIFTSQSTPVEFAYIFRDVTREKQKADAVNWQATHDPLTRMLNRHAITLNIMEAVSGAQQNSEKHVLLYIDLDDFKYVNDQFGHAAGDELLIGICGEMEHCVRKGDRIARIGGDEFAILLMNCDLAHAVNIAEKIRHNVANYYFELEGRRILCSGLSIGINIIDSLSEDWKAVIERADQACYNAKRQGKNQISVA